jgi:Zn-dependent peptidase ImmA (M78 family)
MAVVNLSDGDRMTTRPGSTRDQIEELAEKKLREHGLLRVPIDPVALAVKEGIKVHNAVFAEANLAGMVARRGHNISLLVRSADSPVRKRFTIAHELGHHFLHLHGDADGDFVDRADDVDLFRGESRSSAARRPREEVEANQFAAALLMPRVLVAAEMEKLHNVTVEDLARRFNVSAEAMGIRLHELGY